jgi:hypothetical protein
MGSLLSGCAGLVPLAVKIRSIRRLSPSRLSRSNGSSGSSRISSSNAFLAGRALACHRAFSCRRAHCVFLLVPLLLLTGITACAWVDPGSETDAPERRRVTAEAGRGVTAEAGRGVAAEAGRGVAAEAGRGVAAEAGRVVITVHNDTRPLDEVTILLFPGQPGGGQHTLGTVPPGETRSFTYQADDGTHYLLARRVSWSPVARSRSFIMPESGHIEWSTRVGRVRIHDR